MTSSQHPLYQHLRNETDMCFRSRALSIFEYLELQERDILLDCGCGRGYYIAMARSLFGGKIYGIDEDEEALEVARVYNSSPNVHIAKASLPHLPFPDAHFSKIIFSEVLEHVPDDEASLREIHRVLKPGGTVALTVPNTRYPLLWDPINWSLESLSMRPIRRGLLAGIWANHERLYKLEDLRALVEKSGFEIIKERLLTYFCFPFAHNLVYGIGKTLLLSGALPESLAHSADRYAGSKNSGSLLNPINLARAVFLAIDSLNNLFPPKKSSVAISLKLLKR